MLRRIEFFFFVNAYLLKSKNDFRKRRSFFRVFVPTPVDQICQHRKSVRRHEGPFFLGKKNQFVIVVKARDF